jgi:uncharacterized protein
MKTRHWIVAFVLVGLAAIGLFVFLVRQLTPPPATEAALDPTAAEIAVEFLDHLDAGRYDDAHAMFAPAVAAALDTDKLADLWSTLPGQLGPLQQRSAPRGEKIGEHPVTTVTLQFEHFALDARISVDAELLIDGFRLVPAQPVARAPAPPPEDLAERDFAVGDLALPGRLTLPDGDGPHPAVVLVHGSGPHDRDQTIGPNRPFMEIAHGLADLGIAVLRYDKRTHAHGEDFADGDYTVDRETVDDAVQAIAALRATDGIDRERVFVLGHSLGALLAPRIAERADGVAGLIMLATPARPLDQLVLQQITYLADLDGERSAAESEAIAEAEAAAAAVRALLDGNASQTPAALLLGLPAAYWRDLLGYDAVVSAAALQLPMLLLQGGRDYQVTVDDFVLWQQAIGDRAEVRMQLYPDLNHLFASGDGPSQPAEYFQPAPIDPRPIADIAEWIHGR